MNSDKKKGQKDPSKENIKFILELFNSSKLIDAKKEIDKLIYCNHTVNSASWNSATGKWTLNVHDEKVDPTVDDKIKFSSNFQEHKIKAFASKAFPSPV